MTSSGSAPARASSRPFRTVLIAILVARATAATPPYPIASASVPAHNRRARSSMVAFKRRHFWRTNCSASTPNVDHIEPHLVDPPRSISERDSIDKIIRGPYVADLNANKTVVSDVIAFSGTVGGGGNGDHSECFVDIAICSMSAVSALPPFCVRSSAP
jgi:hypothetical protein